MAEKETVLEILREKHQPQIVPLELPDDDLITEIEEMIYVQIRGDFRNYLLEASDLVVGTLEPVTVTDPGSHTYLPDVASEAWANGLSRELLPFCKTPSGTVTITASAVNDLPSFVATATSCPVSCSLVTM